MQLDCFRDVCTGLKFGLALTMAPVKRGARRDKSAVFVILDDDGERVLGHGAMVPESGFNGQLDQFDVDPRSSIWHGSGTKRTLMGGSTTLQW